MLRTIFWSFAGILILCLFIPYLVLWGMGTISAQVFARVAVTLVAVIHLYFGLLEGTQWNRPPGLQIHKLSQDVADQTRPIGRNMALYNVIFAALLVGSLWLSRGDAYWAQAVLLSLIIVAGLIGTLTIGSPKIVIVQSLPACVALAAVLMGRPGSLREEQAIEQIIAIEKKLIDRKTKARKESGKTVMLRGQHPKSVGFAVADFVIRDDIPPTLKFGVFRTPGRFQAIVRFSNARVMNDAENGGHGMAIKLFEVEGQKLMPEATEKNTQDFLLLDTPSFFIRDAFDYRDFEAAELWATGADGEVRTERLGLAFPNLDSLLKLKWGIQKNPPANPLRATYWSVLPYRLGTQVVKYRVSPHGEIKAPVPGHSASGINEALSASLKSPPEGGWKFDFEVQVQADPDLMPIENAMVRWSEDISKFEKIATIEIKPDESLERFGKDLGLNDPQPSQDKDSPSTLSEHLSFSPWHGLLEHEPLGGINRVRRRVYEELSKLRHTVNGKPRVEPATVEAPKEVARDLQN